MSLTLGTGFGLIVDIDGTLLVHGDRAPGSASFLKKMSGAGVQTLFLTNRTVTPKLEIIDELCRAGNECFGSRLLTAAECAGNRVKGKRVFVVGEGGLLQEISTRASLTDRNPEVVVVGLDRDVTYRQIELAARFIYSGSCFYATNSDASYNTKHGISPGAGAIAKAIETAAGTPPILLGKPSKGIFTQAMKMLGTPPERTMVIGDNLETDIRGGQACGIATVLMAQHALSWPAHGDDVEADWVCDSFQDATSTVYSWIQDRSSQPKRRQ